jgi:hypothetical protein
MSAHYWGADTTMQERAASIKWLKPGKRRAATEELNQCNAAFAREPDVAVIIACIRDWNCARRRLRARRTSEPPVSQTFFTV